MRTKLVNGVAVQFSAEEETARDAEEAQAVIDAQAALIPQSVSMAQARKALVLGGVSMASVAAAIAAISDTTQRELAQIDWEYSTTVRRVSPLVESLGPSLGLTDAQIDALFVAASSL